MGKSLSSKICSLVLSGLFAVSAVSPNSLARSNTSHNNGTPKSFGTRLKEGCKGFYKRHPNLCRAALAITACKVGKLAFREWYLRDVKTKIDTLSKEDVNIELKKEIEKYKNRAPDIFKVDDRLLKLDKRLLLLTFMKLNYLFDKYDLFTEQFIEYKRSGKCRKTFLIRPLNIMDDGVIAGLALEATYLDLSGFSIKNNSLKEMLWNVKLGVDLEGFSESKMDELIEHLIAHEFGHLIETFYIIKKCNLNPCSIHSGGTDTTNKNARTLKKEAFQILDDIDNIKYELHRQGSPDIVTAFSDISFCTSKTPSISKYGDTSPSEFFAETFAHLECSDPKNVNGLGKALDKFIVDTMHYRTPNDKNI